MNQTASLVYPNEKRLLVVATIFSALIWLTLVVGTVGVALFYIGLLYIFFLFAHSHFISYLKGSGVLINAEQYPDLDKMVRESCNKLGMQVVPEAYLIQMGGLFNALATRFLGRNFIVLYSDVVDAMDANPDALRFYIGHELGHIMRGHLKWGPWLVPAGLLPLLGKAYSRSREYTCDRFGLACCLKQEDALQGMAALAAGGKRWGTINHNRFILQGEQTGGFWMSYHEYCSSYPWLVKRMAWLNALGVGKEPKFPSRDPAAAVLAFFGSAKPLLFFLLFVGYIALIISQAKEHLPAAFSGMFGSATTSTSPTSPTITTGLAADVANAIAAVAPAKAGVEQFVAEKNAWPKDNVEAAVPKLSPDYGMLVDSVIVDDGVITILFAGDLSHKSVKLSSEVKDGQVVWECTSETFTQDELPEGCFYVPKD